MADASTSVKKVKKTQRDRNWTDEENALFAELLVDDEYNFLKTLDRLALKCSSNDELVSHIKAVFDKDLNDPAFIATNSFNFKNNKATSLDTSIIKLRAKIKAFKRDWKKFTDRVRTGSGLAPQNEPKWYAILNSVLAETNEEIHLASSAAETSYVQQGKSEAELDENDSSEESDVNDTQPSQLQKTPSVGGKLVVAPHKKRQVIRTQKQALSEIAVGMRSLGESQIKRAKMAIDAEERREQRMLEFRREQMHFQREEAQRNREHELRIAQIYASASNNRGHPQLLQPLLPRAVTPDAGFQCAMVSPQGRYHDRSSTLPSSSSPRYFGGSEYHQMNPPNGTFNNNEDSL